jgi:2-polyprenyl-3-methyl-5-hydroxy-6-metoxy-1,4-benzoquinol methylase
MVNVKKCPHCLSTKRESIQLQTFDDPYLSLIDESLNKIPRYWFLCSKCQFTYRSPALSKQEQEILYVHYRDVGFRNETPDDYFDRISNYNDNDSENFQKVTWFLDNVNKVNFKNSNIDILDIGSGGGVLIHKMLEFLPSSNFYGIEPNELFADLSRRKSGAKNIKIGYYNNNSYSQKFDLIVSSDVLEHVDSQKEFIENIYYDLNSQGILFLIVPSSKNFDSYGPEHDVFNSAHHILYSPETLKEDLVNQGFENIFIKNVKKLNGVWELRAIAYKK